jgi:hypothetical protein
MWLLIVIVFLALILLALRDVFMEGYRGQGTSTLQELLSRPFKKEK